MLKIVVATAALLILTVQTEARSFQPRGPLVQEFCDTRYCGTGIVPRVHLQSQRPQRALPSARCSHHGCDEARMLPHPAGCPSRSFCGCGVALKVFGKPVRELWLAANWFRYPPAQAAPGMVAVRSHHVFYIERVLGGGNVLAYDPNSGGHQTRLHVRNLAGYSVRNPHAGTHLASLQ